MIPLKGTKPFSTSLAYCIYPRQPQALAVQNVAIGIPNCWAAKTVKVMTPSPIIHDAGGVPPLELISEMRLQSGVKQLWEVE